MMTQMTQRWCNSVRALLTMALVVYLVPGANAQGTWTNLAPLPLGGAEGMCVSGGGDIVVAAYGFNSGEGDGNHTRLYNMLTNTWTLGADAPSFPRSEVAYGNTSAGGNVYCIGGRPTSLVGNELQRYTIDTNTWATFAKLPGVGRAAAAAAVVGSSIYLMGGRTGDGGPCSGGPLSEVLRYDVPSDTWFPLAPLPSPRSDFGAMAVGAAGGKIFVFGGCNNTGFLADVDVYDVTTNTWSTSPADMPTARAALSVGQVGNQVFAIGGIGVAGPTPVNEAYNVAKDTWSPASTTGMVPRGETGTYSHAGRIVVPGGGQPAFGTPSDANQSFQPQ